MDQGSNLVTFLMQSFETIIRNDKKNKASSEYMTGIVSHVECGNLKRRGSTYREKTRILSRPTARFPPTSPYAKSAVVIPKTGKVDVWTFRFLPNKYISVR